MSARVVVVTGGSSGIGLATARRFLANGDIVINFDLRPVDPAAADGADGAGAGADAVSPDWRRLDVTDWAGVEQAVGEVINQHARIDVAVANAGISIRHSILETTEAEFRRVLDTNLLGVFALWRACARPMWELGSGVLLATASTNASVGYPYYADYNASKAGVLALTRTFALELSPRVRACAVSPGYVLTPMQRAEYTDQMLAEVNERIPLGRHAAPEEIAELFFFLASPQAHYLTGQQLVADGGELAGGTASQFGVLAAAESFGERGGPA